jgi:hypothetical protein
MHPQASSIIETTTTASVMHPYLSIKSSQLIKPNSIIDSCSSM